MNYKCLCACMWQVGQLPDLLATAGDYLRLWRVTDSEIRQECMLNNVSGTANAQHRHLQYIRRKVAALEIQKVLLLCGIRR